MENARQCSRVAIAKRADDRAGAEGAAVIEERSESKIEGPKERLAGADRERAISGAIRSPARLIGSTLAPAARDRRWRLGRLQPFPLFNRRAIEPPIAPDAKTGQTSLPQEAVNRGRMHAQMLRQFLDGEYIFGHHHRFRATAAFLGHPRLGAVGAMNFLNIASLAQSRASSAHQI
jgi:hypothetical protein